MAQEAFRIQRDKFQIATREIADAICLYFCKAHPETVITNVHSARLIIHDLAVQYKKSGQIESFEFWTSLYDANAEEKLFSRNNAQGYFHERGNFVKHADRSPRRAIMITDQMAFSYLYGTLVDYLQLQASLLESGIIGRKVQDDVIDRNFKALPVFSPWKLLKYISAQREARIDSLAGIFLNWKRITDGASNIDIKFLSNEFGKNAAKTNIALLPRLFVHAATLRTRFDACVVSGILEATHFLRVYSDDDYNDEKTFQPYEKRQKIKQASRAIIWNYICRQNLDFGKRDSGYHIIDVELTPQDPALPTINDNAKAYEFDEILMTGIDM